MSSFNRVAIACVAVAFAACSQNMAEPISSDFEWGPAPAIFPAGAQLAVIQGDPSSDQPVTVRLRMPDGYRLPPHTHPTDEHVTVLRGTFLVGMGETFDGDATQALGPGGFITAPANHAHFARARGETVVQVHLIGPFVMTYVNPADDPTSAGVR